jgi:pyruvate dehydrogenase (quinone)
MCPVQWRSHGGAGFLDIGRPAQRVRDADRDGSAGHRPDLAETLQAPVVHAFRGKEFVEYGNPFDVGMTGLIGFSSGYRAMEHCDALLMLGTDFPYRPFFPQGVPVVQVDMRGEQIGRRVPVDVPLVGTVKDTVDALLPLITAKTDSAHLDRMTAHYRRVRARLDRLAESRRSRSPLHPQSVATAIDRLAADDAVFTADVGTPCIWAARYLRMNGRRRLIGSFNHGSMANALPQAIGAQASQPSRQVIALSGDGGVAMLLGELITLRQLQLPVKVVVFNNGALSFVELEMKAAGIVTYGTDLDNPDFAAIAQAVGLFGARVEKAGELDDALRAAFGHDGPALVDVRTDRYELSVPPKLTFGEIKGFTLYATRTILSGEGEELVELTKSNLRDLEVE